MNRWMDGWMDGWMNESMDRCEWIDEQLYGMDEWMDG